MEVIVIESEAFEQLKLEIKQYVKLALKELLEEKNLSDNNNWITIDEAMKLLPYKSKSTWQKLRDNGLIEISQSLGSRNILYSKKSIQNYINKHRVKF